jgi:hypothetical protein
VNSWVIYAVAHETRDSVTAVVHDRATPTEAIDAALQRVSWQGGVDAYCYRVDDADKREVRIVRTVEV